LTKADLAKKISEQHNLEEAQVKQIIESFYAVVIKAMSKKRTIYLRHFETFYVVKKTAKLAQDIRKKQPVMVPTHYTPRFRPSEFFKKIIK
jgi:nucleoid DNA-binding protein